MESWKRCVCRRRNGLAVGGVFMTYRFQVHSCWCFEQFVRAADPAVISLYQLTDG